MSFIDCFTNSIGSITILTVDGFVFQGQIVKNREQDRSKDSDFILLELTCDAAIVDDDDAQFRTINPRLYRDGDIVRINVCQVIAIGPSSGCPTNPTNGVTSD